MLEWFITCYNSLSIPLGQIAKKKGLGIASSTTTDDDDDDNNKVITATIDMTERRSRVVG
jgi:hypothetical protein